MATHRWIRTVVSRCSSLDIILVENSEGLKINFKATEMRISNHKETDIAKFPHLAGKWDEKDYITVDWTTTTLKRQRFSCAECSDPLNADWSIDRRVNELPHTKANCQICCLRCNCASAHRV